MNKNDSKSYCRQLALLKQLKEKDLITEAEETKLLQKIAKNNGLKTASIFALYDSINDHERAIMSVGDKS